jgi:F-type H+-transporting ATPase subunit b
MKTILIAAVLALAPATAAAQHAGHAEVPLHGAGGEGHEPKGAGHDEHGDPSKSFNWTQGLDLSYKKKDAHGGTLDQGEEPMSVPFVLVLLNFGILLVLLGWKVGPIVRQVAAKRSDEIKAALDEAARLRSQAKDKLDEYSHKLRAAETEIDDMIKMMRTDAEAERARIIAAAEAQAAALKKDAEQQIAAEIERARMILQREVVAAAAGVAEALLRDHSTAADQARLVDDFIKDVA